MRIAKHKVGNAEAKIEDATAEQAAQVLEGYVDEADQESRLREEAKSKLLDGLLDAELQDENSKIAAVQALQDLRR